jgi:predicted AlkP superfamily phosphohydrolase/phosphomutase
VNLRRRVLVVGLDGGTFSILKPLIGEGKLKNFKYIMENGVSGPLKSTLPPYTATAWASFATGKNPGKHGIYDFLVKKGGSKERVFVNSKLIRGEKIWNILGRYGKKVGVINFPISYPLEKVNGFMIAGFMSPQNAETYSYPPDLFKTLIDKIGDYIIHVRFIEAANYKEREIKQYVDKNLKATELRTKALLYLMDEYDWDFLFILFMNFDRIQHAFWKYIVGEYKDGGIRDYILKCYYQIDEILGILLEKLDDNTSLIIMSDHGFCSAKKIFRVNQWLADNGFLKYDTKKLILDKISRRIRKKLGLKKGQSLIGGDMSTEFLNVAIDWRNTVAFFTRTTQQAINLNLEDKWKDGVVYRSREYSDLRDEIKRRLLEYRDEETGEPVFENVYFPEEIYSGPFLEEAPDIILSPSEGYFLSANLTFPKRQTLEVFKKPSGIHHPNGIFLAIGDLINAGEIVTDANIIDIAPTILYLLGVPIPRDMDGKVLTNIFREEFLNENPIEYSEPLPVSKSLSEEEPYSEEDKENIKKTLKGLGYLD